MGENCEPVEAKSLYDLWLEAGNEGTIQDFLDTLQGDTGESAYDIWLKMGNSGTLSTFLNSLKAKTQGKRLTQLPMAEEVNEDMRVLVETPTGTYYVKVSDLVDYFSDDPEDP